MKVVYDEIYKDYQIIIESKFMKDHYIWGEGYTNVVRLDYSVFNPIGEPLHIESYQFEMVPQPKVKKFLFWKIKPKLTFKEEVEEWVSDLVLFLQQRIDKELFENEVTDGLMDSLKQFN